MKESTIESKVCAYAKSKGILVMKLASSGLRGQPDRMFLMNGKAAFIEFKAPGKKPTALQMKWLRDLQGEEFDAFWVDNAEDGIEWLNEVFKIK